MSLVSIFLTTYHIFKLISEYSNSMVIKRNIGQNLIFQIKSCTISQACENVYSKNGQSNLDKMMHSLYGNKTSKFNFLHINKGNSDIGIKLDLIKEIIYNQPNKIHFVSIVEANYTESDSLYKDLLPGFSIES